MASDGKYHRFSVKEAYAFPLLTDDTTDGLTYGTGIKVEGVQTVNVTKNYTTERLSGDDSVIAVEKTLESVALELEHAKVSHELLEVLEGGEQTTTGSAPNDKSRYTLRGADQAGYFKLEFRTTKLGKNGSDIWHVYPKCSAGTIGNTNAYAAFGENSFSAEAVRTETTGVTTATDDLVYFEEERGSGVAATIASTVTPDTTAPTVTTTPTDGATGVVVSANLTLDFDELMDLSTLTVQNIKIIKASDGTFVSLSASNLSYNSSTHVLTIDPSSSLTGSTAYILTLSDNIKDAQGNRLAATAVNFTTA